MARFFFDLVDGAITLRDQYGAELLNLSMARLRARVLAYATVEKDESPVQPYDNREIHVRADTGERVATIAFRYVIA